MRYFVNNIFTAIQSNPLTKIALVQRIYYDVTIYNFYIIISERHDVISKRMF